ncbi:SRPBCC family protein [Marinicella sp. S1101]|uniref:SRPBCC family protein n=1 Tax=Marinicella marina TaxID=2996016 RepID=UPI002260AA85|nr:SRPBCC family protein [Marinicella marina]MCX7553573.1 SRPBCC family protein [Marinicella marina]MDJ1140197.1 SRPBCC family protein [Marinicella marina]
MQKVHVTVNFNQDLKTVFNAIVDHRSFLSGGGLTCRLTQDGKPHKNGQGAIRKIRTKKYTLTEKITAYEHLKSYDYLITDIAPKVNFTHHNGWIEFTPVDDHIRVDWHSHFTFNTPIIGRMIGYFVQQQTAKIFLQRLNYVRNNLSKVKL